MRILIFLIFISLFGCGKKFDTVIDAEPKFSKTNDPSIFQAQVTEFLRAENSAIPNKNLNSLSAEQQAIYLMQSIPINLDDLTLKYKAEKYIGVCVKSSKSGKREILIDKAYWQNNPNQRTPLIVHELGHCWPSIQREHYTAPIGSNCKSIMEARLISIYDYEKYKEYLWHELFNKLGELKIKNPNTPAPCKL